MSNDKSYSTTDSDDVVMLAQGFCDGTLSGSDTDRLEQLLLGNPPNQRIFLTHVDLHARLCWEAGHGTPLEREPSLPRTTRLPVWGWPAAAVALLLLIIAGIWSPSYFASLPIAQPQPTVSASSTLVTVIHSAGVSTDQVASLAPGTHLLPGTLELPGGIVELGYPSGVQLLLESPARLQLIDANHVFLESGRLVVRVPKGAIGFAIESDRASIVDLGTEFGVSVGPKGATLVQVYEGAVDAELKGPAGEQQESHRLTSGEAIALDASVRPVTFAPHLLIRSFPVQPKENEPIRLSNSSHLESVPVNRAAPPPRIDGDLRDWNREKMFVSHCDEPNHDRYFIEGRCMYDDKRLYFAAHVGDPMPLSSTVDPVEEPDFYWTGGSVVLRVAASDSFGWPLQAVRPRDPKGVIPDPDGSNHIVHIGMWYSLRTNKPQLMVQYGMDCHGQMLCPDGWEGEFRKDPDGRGYTMEYAIDLRLLNVDRPPRPGDVWAANLNVHWSDRDGRTCMGQLGEITNLGNQPHKTFDGKTWGKLIFENN